MSGRRNRPARLAAVQATIRTDNFWPLQNLRLAVARLGTVAIGSQMRCAVP